METVRHVPWWWIPVTEYESAQPELVEEWGKSPEQARFYLRLIQLPEEIWEQVMAERGCDPTIRAHVIVACGTERRLDGVLAQILIEQDMQQEPRLRLSLYDYRERARPLTA